MRDFIKYIITVIFALIILPISITLLYNNQHRIKIPTETEVKLNNEPQLPEKIKVYSPEIEIIDDIGIEEYIKGVVAAEMPVSFEEEALKAQAVAARTYALKKLGENENIAETDISQAYLSKEELKQRWGNNYNTYWNKISKAVDSTRNQIMTYNDEIIEAVFHSTSAGFTENSENIWSQSLPYLKGVDSHQDENAPDFVSTKSISSSEIIGRLQNKYKDIILTDAPLIQQIQIIERSEGGYILQIQIGNKILSGADVRILLNLKSTNFTVKQNGDDLIFTTKGYGHGVGMSQYGANYMAQEGYKYDEILKHYYQGVKIEANKK